ncbi:MAG TPA: hypothetical protein VF668_16225 [Pyrinomonadaceae bacterium]|jgi:hypothetical protein
MLKARIVFVALLWAPALGLASPCGAAAQRRRAAAPRRPPAVCGDPTAPCPTSAEFKPHDLPFRLSQNSVIWESEQFYAVILKSVRDERLDGTVFVPEEERLAAQKLFPRHKVFASRGAGEPGEIFYSNVDGNQQFMAVYAGRTRAEAAAVLARVRATGQFPGANLRRMHIGFNGT